MKKPIVLSVVQCRDVDDTPEKIESYINYVNEKAFNEGNVLRKAPTCYNIYDGDLPKKPEKTAFNDINVFMDFRYIIGIFDGSNVATNKESIPNVKFLAFRADSYFYLLGNEPFMVDVAESKAADLDIDLHNLIITVEDNMEFKKKAPIFVDLTHVPEDKLDSFVEFVISLTGGEHSIASKKLYMDMGFIGSDPIVNLFWALLFQETVYQNTGNDSCRALIDNFVDKVLIKLDRYNLRSYDRTDNWDIYKFDMNLFAKMNGIMLPIIARSIAFELNKNYGTAKFCNSKNRMVNMIMYKRYPEFIVSDGNGRYGAIYVAVNGFEENFGIEELRSIFEGVIGTIFKPIIKGETYTMYKSNRKAIDELYSSSYKASKFNLNTPSTLIHFANILKHSNSTSDMIVDMMGITDIEKLYPTAATYVDEYTKEYHYLHDNTFDKLHTGDIVPIKY